MNELESTQREPVPVTTEHDIAKENFALVCESLGMGSSRDIATAIKLIDNLHGIADFRADTISEYTIILPPGTVRH
jgi:hypothetical protein